MKFPWEHLPLSGVVDAFKAGVDATHESNTPVRVAVYVDTSAPRGMVSCIRDAFVPQTTSALVRVERLSAEPVAPKADTDVVLVLTAGSDVLEEGVHRLVVAGVPVCVVAESSVEVPFIGEDTPLLGLVCAHEPAHLREALARWILDRTDKDAAFAANFTFMRETAANRIVTSTALVNMATGAIVFVRGSNYPVMALAEVRMALKLAATYGYRLHPERAYEVVAVLGGGLLLRGVSRSVCAQVPRLAFLVKALVGGFGTYGMGMALTCLYAHGVDYHKLNELLATIGAEVREGVQGVRVRVQDRADVPAGGAATVGPQGEGRGESCA